MSIEILVTTITSLGIGGLITAIVSYYLSKGKEIDFKKHEQKEKRYRSVLLYMDVYFEPQNIKFLSSRQPDISSQKDVIEYLKAEYHEMLLYSPKSVLLAVKKFIDNPIRENFLSAILEMRQDLWIKKKDLNADEIRVDFPKG
ncbi:MAG: hypothetical protein WC386_00125 [Candidatus Paceibacterota bacterium]|jgi:hypothetical protein